MISALRKTSIFLLLLAFCFSAASCDLFGSDDSSPDWVGNWEVADDGAGYWELSEGELRIANEAEFDDDIECFLVIYEVTEQDGNVVTIVGTSPAADGDEVELRFEVSDETLTATILDDPDGDTEGEEVTLDAIDEIPLDLDNCRTDLGS